MGDAQAGQRQAYRKRPLQPRDTEAIRRCRTCNEIKPLTYEHFTFRQRGGYGTECRPCSNARNMERVRPRREHMQAVKMAAGCSDCGYREHPAALEFDHRDPATKLRDPNEFVNFGSWHDTSRDRQVRCGLRQLPPHPHGEQAPAGEPAAQAPSPPACVHRPHPGAAPALSAS